jgi:hypothetical protein
VGQGRRRVGGLDDVRKNGKKRMASGKVLLSASPGRLLLIPRLWLANSPHSPSFDPL